MTNGAMKLGFAFPLFLAASIANGSELGFLGSVGLQYKQLKMDQTFDNVPQLTNNTGHLTASLPVINLQAITFYKSFYAIAKVETPLAKDSTNSSIPFTTENTSAKTDVKRRDYSITLGYKISKILSVFGGYMYGKTTLTPNACAGCTNPATTMKNDGFGEYHQNYQEDGIFLGVTSGWHVGNGQISASLAYAKMRGKYTDNFKDTQGTPAFDFEGNSNGFSAALSWTAPITEKLFYFTDARLQKYSMDASDKTGAAYFSGSTAKTDETILGLSAGVQMLF